MILQQRIVRLAAAVAAAVALAGLAGCAAPAHQANMEAEALAPAKKLPYTVSVQTAGGQETGVMDSSNVSNADLKAAIENSITRTSLFKSVVQGRNGEYELNVTVTQLDKPLFGGAFTVTLETGWSLVRASDKSVVMRKAIKTSHTATMGESLVGVTRLRLALEGAVRKNISEGLQSISALPI